MSTHPPGILPAAMHCRLNYCAIRCAHGSKLPLARCGIVLYCERRIVLSAVRDSVVPAGALQLNPYPLGAMARALVLLGLVLNLGGAVVLAIATSGLTKRGDFWAIKVGTPLGQFLGWVLLSAGYLLQVIGVYIAG